jgi:predicted XRE-type DNA-binding protein
MTHSVFEDLGFSPQKAAALKLKADLHTKIVKAASGFSQGELEKILQTSQPRISDLLRGKMSKFSLDMLVFYAEQLGLETSIKTHARTRGASAGTANLVRQRSR